MVELTRYILIFERYMHSWNRKERSLFLLFTVLVVFIATPFVEHREGGEILVVANLYLALVAAAVKLSEKRALRFLAVPLAIASMTFLWLNHMYDAWALTLASYASLTVFIGLACVSMFLYLDRSGEIGSERIYVSVCLYLLMALGWFALYSLIDTIEPGSFAEAGVVLTGKIDASKILYFSLTTLTTLGLGDILAIRPAARMFASLEAAAGVLYIAITVARLVASYQVPDRSKS